MVKELKFLRKKCGLTIAQVAKGVGCSHVTVYAIENDKNVSHKTFEKYYSFVIDQAILHVRKLKKKLKEIHENENR
jgi:DNA-binding XRE family transcriptional regulator